MAYTVVLLWQNLVPCSPTHLIARIITIINGKLLVPHKINGDIKCAIGFKTMPVSIII